MSSPKQPTINNSPVSSAATPASTCSAWTRSATSRWIRTARSCCSKSSPPGTSEPRWPARQTPRSPNGATPSPTPGWPLPSSTGSPSKPTSSKPAPAATGSAPAATRKEPPTPKRPQGGAKSGQHSGAKSSCHSQVVNLTDPESGWMPTTKGWIQGYNTQLVVSDDHLIIGCKVTTATVDVNQFEPMLAEAAHGAAALDRGRTRAGMAAEPIGLVLADAGYLSEDNLTAPGPDRLIATGKRGQVEAAAREGRPTRQKSQLIEQMSRRLATPDGIAAYRRRGVTVEPVNGHLKDRQGLRQFVRRGRAACQAEAELAATTANLWKIWRRR